MADPNDPSVKPTNESDAEQPSAAPSHDGAASGPGPLAPLPSQRRANTMPGAASVPRPVVSPQRVPMQVPAPSGAADRAAGAAPAPRTKPPIPRRPASIAPGPLEDPAAPRPKPTKPPPALTTPGIAPPLAATLSPPAAAPVAAPAPAPAPAPVVEEETTKIGPESELRRRAERLRQEGDDVGAARAFVELGLYLERVLEDRAAARVAYEAARGLSRSLEPALTRIRRLLEANELATALDLLDDELAVAEGEGLKADLWAERARVCDALGRMAEARLAYAEALRNAPAHPAALRGLESVLRREVEQAGPSSPAHPLTRDAASRSAPHPPGADKKLPAELAAHLERLADAYAPAADRPDGDGRLTAWLHVERAGVLERRLKEPEAARLALERAVAFEPSPGPVRDALTRHLVRHDEIGILVGSLSVEAEQERDDDRASRLLYTAARLVIDRIGAPAKVVDARDRVGQPGLADATHLLQRAAARAPDHTPTAYRILAELVRLLELGGDLAQAAEVRQKRLALLTRAGAAAEVVAHEHVRLSEIFDGLGHADQAAYHAEQALALDPDDGSTRERLDRALQRLGRHDERVRAWVGEANAHRPVPARVAALLRAADIAERHLRRRDEAVAHLRAGWAVDPGNASIFEALSALVAPPPRDPESDGRGVRARIDLYAQAAAAATDRARRVGLLEKLTSIWEDELGQPARALEEIEQILAIEPDRRTAILAMARNAQRAGDHARLARALTAEADLTGDGKEQRRLLLRAAEVHADLVGDRDRALALVERALGIDAADPDALRARLRLQEKAGRFEDARKTLIKLIGAERDEARRFALWLEVARLDEQRQKRPFDAAAAYANAAALRPKSPLPALEMVRILRAEGDAKKLVEALMGLCASAPDEAEYAKYLFQAAEVQEMMLRDDAAAQRSLRQAEGLTHTARDPALLEALERIHVRAGNVLLDGGSKPRRPDGARDLCDLYTRWLEQKPPAAVDHGLRIALAGALAEDRTEEATAVLEGLVAVVPSHVPALRMLEQLHRAKRSQAALAAVLRGEADVLASSRARAGALWELVSLEPQIGPAATLDALARLVGESPRDAAALDATVRIAGKLVTGVPVLLSAALTTRARLVPAIQARKELCRDPVARAVYQIEEALLIEAHAPDDAHAVRASLAGYQAALALWPESLLAARGLERQAERVADRPSLVQSQLVLSRLVHAPRDRAAHMVRAAALTSEDPTPRAQADALALYEEALRTDADCVAAAAALGRMLAADVPRLVDRLGAALEAAAAPDQVRLLGTEIGRAILRQRDLLAASGRASAEEAVDPGIGVTAMRKVLAVTPDDVASLLLTARLLLAQRLWAEAREALQRAILVAPSGDGESRIVAHLLLADLFETKLGDLAEAQASFRAILAIDDKHRAALEGTVRIAGLRGDRGLGVRSLARLAEITVDPAARVEIDIRLAEACREAGDSNGRVRALADAIATAPGDPRPGAVLARLYRTDTPDGATCYVGALQQVIDIANARRLPLDPRWFTTMGMMEITVMLRAREGIAHLTQATQVPGAPPDARVALGRGLEAAGRNADAVQVFRDVLTVDGEVFARVTETAAALGSLEAALAKDGRVEERLAVEETRACLGDVKPERLARLRARRLPEGAPFADSLAGAELRRMLVPEARTPLLDVAAAVQPIAAKILRFELGNIGISSRDRLSPRDGHPTRALGDRLAQALGIEGFEIYLSPSWQGAARVYPGDPPAIVGPTSFADLPEPEQAYALARLLTRAALGPTWLDELPVDAADGLFLAVMRAVEPGFAGGELTPSRESMAQSFLPAVQRAIGRRQRKQIEELAPSVTSNYDARVVTIGVRRSEYRVAYVLGGDLIAAIDYLRRFDRDIGRSTEDPRVLLTHPVTNELLRYALSADSVAERRRVGAVWG